MTAQCGEQLALAYPDKSSGQAMIDLAVATQIPERARMRSWVTSLARHLSQKSLILPREP